MIFSNSIFLNSVFSNSAKPRTTLQLVVISTFGIFLSGCVGMGNKFDCNVDSGGRCAPMHHINQMANYGAFTERLPKADKSVLAEIKDMGTKQNIYGTTPIRSNEKTQQIWIGPYEDANGNFHEGSYVYAVVKKSSWNL